MKIYSYREIGDIDDDFYTQMEWVNVPEQELREYDYPIWRDVHKMRLMPDELLTWEHFIAEWVEANNAVVLHEYNDEQTER